MQRLKTRLDQLKLDEDDLKALELLRPGSLRSRDPLPAEARGKTVWEEDPDSDSFGLLGGLSPICEAAMSIWGLATVKPAITGMPRKAHYWCYVVLGIDLSKRSDHGLVADEAAVADGVNGSDRQQPGAYHLLGEYLPLAVAAGISVDAIERVAEGRLDELDDDDRQFVGFIRGALNGTLTDEQWRNEVDLVGERAAAKQVHLILFLWAYVRVCEALDRGDRLTEEGLNAMLKRLREGGERADIQAFENYYRTSPWPRPADQVGRQEV